MKILPTNNLKTNKQTFGFRLDVKTVHGASDITKRQQLFLSQKASTLATDKDTLDALISTNKKDNTREIAFVTCIDGIFNTEVIKYSGKKFKNSFDAIYIYLMKFNQE